MSQTVHSEAAPRLTAIQWVIVVIAAIGFLFDIYELLMLPLILPPALRELIGAQPQTPQFDYWKDLLFWIPAIAGGVFGLLGGYLTDRFGRRTVLTYSILLYAFSALGAGFAKTVEMLLVLRCLTFIGFCVEFVAAVAWLAELFPHPKQREAVLGYTQFFSSFGGVVVALVNHWLVEYAHAHPDGLAAWRLTLMSGVIPALPLIVVRPFLPESPVWREKKNAGTLRRPSFAELFSPALRRATLVSTALMALVYGVAFGALQQLPQIIPGLSQVREQLTPPDKLKEMSGEEQLKAKQNNGRVVQSTAAEVQTWQETGGLVGRFALATLAMWIVSRRALLRVFQIPAMIVVPLVFLFPAVTDLNMLKWTIPIAGFLVVAQFSFWGNYLPRVFPVHLRGTGESFAANVGGRIIGTSAVLLTTQVAKFMPAATPPTKQAYAAAAVAFTLSALALMLTFALPEPNREQLPE